VILKVFLVLLANFSEKSFVNFYLTVTVIV